ncbi:MAG TPA: post-COAP-1 domain-containing protein [Gaiellaceae bacterium]|jgi:hypothetical protein
MRFTLAAALVVAALAAVPAFGAGVSPQTVSLQLNPGQSATVTKQVETTKLPPKSDFVFLADNTSSMGPSINDVKANAQTVIDAIEASGATDARYGVGNYEDFTQSGPCLHGFELDTDLTDATAAKAAINTWVAEAGCDIAEANFFGLHRVAVHDISWRPDSTRFVVWFGDAPSHDPICDALPSYSDPHSPITEASVTADLQAQGIHVVAVSAPSGPGLDADPTVLSSDYGVLCGPPDGLAGQATRIAAATGGVHLVNPPATSISQTIIDAINALPPIPVVVTPVATCDAGLTVTNSPPTQTVPSGSTATFTETIAVSPAAPLGSTLHCSVDFTINGASAGPEFVQHVTVEVGHGVPVKLELTPENATNIVDETHCVTATVTDAFGAPVPNTAVDFTVAGSVVTSGTRTTNGSGQAEFCYVGPSFPGADLITATAQAGTHPSDTANKEWVLPGSTEGCKVTGGGRFTAANGDKATFGGNAQGSGPSGEEEYQDHGAATDINVHSTAVLAVSCSRDGTSATIFGTATVNGSGSYMFRIDVKDLAEPGVDDRYRIRLSNGYDSGDQQLTSGNIQIH